MKDEFQFLDFFMYFLSNHGRSGNLFVGNAISTTHFAQVCALRVWRDIFVLSCSDNRPYVHSAIPNALLDNILDRVLAYLYDVMNLLITSDVPLENSFELADETMIQNIKVGQTPIYLSLGPLNRNIFIRRTKMHIDDITDLVKFVEVTANEKESFRSQLFLRRNTKRMATAPIGSTMVRSPIILSIACVTSCSTDISISDTFWGKIAARRS